MHLLAQGSHVIWCRQTVRFILSCIFTYQIFILCCKHHCLSGIIQPGMISGSALVHFRECTLLQKLLVVYCWALHSAVRARHSSSPAADLPLSQAQSFGCLISEKYCGTCPRLYSSLKFFVHIQNNVESKLTSEKGEEKARGRARKKLPKPARLEITYNKFARDIKNYNYLYYTRITRVFLHQHRAFWGVAANAILLLRE